MSSNHSFPVILVSAGNKLSAKSIISDIIDNEPTELETGNASACCRVWRITNKYYTANVHLHPIIDGESTEFDTDSVQAHVIHLAENECEESVAERRYMPVGGGEATRMVVAQCSEPPESLEAWSRRRRYELVPLLEPVPPPTDPDEPFPDLCGMQRIRAVLHAQRWDISRARGKQEGASDTESSDGGDYRSEDEEVAVERMEEFCTMLGVVGGGERNQLAGLPRDERLRRAEDLVAAFCRAMGDHSDRW